MMPPSAASQGVLQGAYYIGHAVATRRVFQSRKSGQRLFPMQHMTADRALAPAFDLPHPDRLNFCCYFFT